ncbi:MAG: phosphatidylinositol mannoside acyltransferase, partial [Actinobacteria bacterium]|nr:phosphatidylinositol mannoside acyltransferase [Actinomycetota bacterium]
MTSALRLRAEGVGWITGWQISRKLPERMVVRAFERMSARSYRTNARRREIVRANLEPVVGAERLDDVVRDAFRWYGRYWAETFRIPDLSDAEFDRRLSVEGDEHIQAAHDGGRGGLLATLHQGNWDAGGRWVAKRWGVTAVAEVLRPRALFERFVEHREALGIKIIPLEKGSEATARCRQELELGRLVALVSERDMSGGGIEVTMFGRRT